MNALSDCRNEHYSLSYLSTWKPRGLVCFLLYCYSLSYNLFWLTRKRVTRVSGPLPLCLCPQGLLISCLKFGKRHNLIKSLHSEISTKDWEKRATNIYRIPKLIWKRLFNRVLFLFENTDGACPFFLLCYFSQSFNSLLLIYSERSSQSLALFLCACLLISCFTRK